VPHGSVLGLILFLIFINDLDKETKALEIVRKFADDTKLGQGVGTDMEGTKLQEALHALVAWVEKWGMQFNVAKCKVMHLGGTNSRHAYQMSGHQLATLRRSWTMETFSKVQEGSMAQTVLGQLTRGIHYRDRHVFVRLYLQYARPHLEFASLA
jgi:ribonuclease P/MRP protein subunit RPP40